MSWCLDCGGTGISSRQEEDEFLGLSGVVLVDCLCTQEGSNEDATVGIELSAKFFGYGKPSLAKVGDEPARPGDGLSAVGEVSRAHGHAEG